MNSTANLSVEASQRAIENAVRIQSQVVLESPLLGKATINGFLISGDEAALLLEMTGQLPVQADRLVREPCDVRMYSDRRYRFSSTITGVPKWGASRSLAIARPKTIGITERRRFIRAKLAPSTRVKIEWQHEGVTHRHVAAMLNISPEGLACRIDEGEAALIPPGALVRLRLDLPGDECSLDVGSTVCNKTPASEGSTILGLHFERTPDAEGDLVALRDALDHSQHAPAGSEVCT